MGKYYGEAEARLRSIFQKAARSAPCIIFIDEIDSLAPDRSKAEGEVEKRVVAQLLSLMDGFAKTKGVIVLAATNRPDHLDPALRRPGRFDREIQFRVPDRSERLDLQLKVDLPDQASRLAILQVHNHDRPLAEVDLEQFAAQTEGWNGADLALLSNQAALEAVRRYRASASEDPNTLQITAEDFAIAHQRLLLQREMTR
jgi:transitional endoplasmic reticulum ATPase